MPNQAGLPRRLGSTASANPRFPRAIGDALSSHHNPLAAATNSSSRASRILPHNLLSSHSERYIPVDNEGMNSDDEDPLDFAYDMDDEENGDDHIDYPSVMELSEASEVFGADMEEFTQGYAREFYFEQDVDEDEDEEDNETDSDDEDVDGPFESVDEMILSDEYALDSIFPERTAEGPSNLPESDSMLSSFWPGLVGTRPLNSSPRPSSEFESGRESLRRSRSAGHVRNIKKSNPQTDLDPSSSTSPSSFLQPGVLFTGRQIFVPHKRISRPSIAWSDPPFETSQSLSFRRDAVSASPAFGSRANSAYGAALTRSPAELADRVTSPTLWRGPQDLPRSSQDSALPLDTSSRRGVYSHEAHPYSSAQRPARSRNLMISNASTGLAARTRGRDLSPASADDNNNRAEDQIYRLSPSARARLRNDGELSDVRQRVNRLIAPSAEDYDRRWARPSRSGTELAADSIENPSPLEGSEINKVASADPTTDEHWAVRVVIHSYCKKTNRLTGLMHALGVPDSSAQVTTYFHGEVIDLPVESIWTRKWGAKRKDDAEYWSKLGPFKDLEPEELAVKVEDPDWLRVMSSGWLFMRWKEVDFVNVTPAESTLSIAGHYYIALSRSDGQLEGLYFDRVSCPFQRLVLTPAPPSAPFSCGTFGFL